MAKGKASTKKSTTSAKKKKPATVGERARKRSTTRAKKSKKAGGGRITDAEMLYRMRLVEQALIDGKRTGAVIDMLAEAGRVVPYTTVIDYMQRVREKWEQEDSLLRPLWRERQLRKLHDIAEQLELGQHWGHWVNVQRLIAQVEGNLAPQKYEVEHHSDPFDGWSVQELKRFVKSNGKDIPERFGEESVFNRFAGKDNNEVRAGNGDGQVTLH